MKRILAVALFTSLLVALATSGGCSLLQTHAETARLQAETQRIEADAEARRAEILTWADAEARVSAAEAQKANAEALLEQAQGDRTLKEAVAEQLEEGSRSLDLLTAVVVVLLVVILLVVLLVIMLVVTTRRQEMIVRQIVERAFYPIGKPPGDIVPAGNWIPARLVEKRRR